MSKQLSLFPEDNYVPFVSEVEQFNKLMNKPNNYEPTIPGKKDWQFVIDFVKEELEEYEQACKNGTMLHGLKDKIWPAYQEVQASNLSKTCQSQEEARLTVEKRSKEQGEPCHWEEVSDMYIVYRTRDRKVMKSINYFRPDLEKFFTNEELTKFNK